MSSNPYESSAATRFAGRTRPTRWLIVVGVGALLLAALCLVATVLGMMWSFQSIADSNTSPEPSNLAAGISAASMPSFAAVPLAIVGIFF